MATDVGWFARRRYFISTEASRGMGPGVGRDDASIFPDYSMDARDVIKVGMSAERSLVVPAEQTVGHFVKDMPMVFATPMMILQMELASADAVKPCLEPGWVTVGTEVDIRHLAATPVGALVRTTARVIAVERRLIRFEVEAFDDRHRIGEGRHARGLVNVEAFTKRFGGG